MREISSADFAEAWLLFQHRLSREQRFVLEQLNAGKSFLDIIASYQAQYRESLVPKGSFSEQLEYAKMLAVHGFYYLELCEHTDSPYILNKQREARDKFRWQEGDRREDSLWPPQR